MRTLKVSELTQERLQELVPNMPCRAGKEISGELRSLKGRLEEFAGLDPDTVDEEFYLEECPLALDELELELSDYRAWCDTHRELLERLAFFQNEEEILSELEEKSGLV